MLAVATAATALSALLAGKGSMVGATAAAAAGDDGSCPAGGEDGSCTATTTTTTRAAPEETTASTEEGGFFSRFSFPSLGSLFGEKILHNRTADSKRRSWVEGPLSSAGCYIALRVGSTAELRFFLPNFLFFGNI